MKRTAFLADRFVAEFSKSAVHACLPRMTEQEKKSFTARYSKTRLVV
jgi:hypothetical protein